MVQHLQGSFASRAQSAAYKNEPCHGGAGPRDKEADDSGAAVAAAVVAGVTIAGAAAYGLYQWFTQPADPPRKSTPTETQASSAAAGKGFNRP